MPSLEGRTDISSAPGEGSLEEVRKRLQSFGYLNSRIERFYLSSLTRSASLFFSRLMLSSRVGLLAGTVSALLMTAGTLIFNEGLLRNKLDLLLLFLYLEIFFLLSFSLLELMLIYTVSAVLGFTGGRRLYFAGQVISFLIGLGFFAYFYFWGRSQLVNLHSASPLMIGLMFAVVVVSSLFVAKCSWLGFLVAFWHADVGRRAPDWRRYGLEVALAVTAIVMSIPLIISQSKTEVEESVPVAVVTTPDQWLVIAIDGMPAEYLKRFETSGDIPFLTETRQQSAFLRLDVHEPVVPPVSWTTIATGVAPAEHGVLLPDVRRLGGLTSWMQITPFQLAFHSVIGDSAFGQRQPVSGYIRKSKTFWEILSDTGIEVGVANWWGSWPARKIRGWNVSERYFYKKVSREKSQNETYPSELFDQFTVSGGKPIRGPELDQFYMNIFRKQLIKHPVRVAALYLPGLDILNHEFFQKRSSDPFRYTELYRAHLKWLDEQLLALSQEHPGYQLMIVLYQGRSFSGDRSGLLIRHPQASASRPMTISETEIVPFLLYSCGVPIARSMPPDMIRALFPPAVLAKNPVRFVPAYVQKQDQVQPAHADEFNDILVEQMKSLGYLQ